MPKLILLNGFAGNGKSTLAKRYAENHPLALNIEGDQLITMIGGWKDNYDKARECITPLTLSLTKTHLSLGHDVIIPYLLVNDNDAKEFEKIAEEANAQFYEIMLKVDKEEAVNRLMKRGSWGEEGLPPLTEKDIPEIEELFDMMEYATALRPNTINIEVHYGEIDQTYQSILRQLQH